jgi:PTS system nitrogen regulatory IIA component
VKIVDILSEDLIIPDLAANTRDAALAELVDCMAASRKEIDRDFALRVLLERERVGSTAVGNGLAFPHARMPTIHRVIGCLGRSRPGVLCRANDSQATHLFVAILAPETGGLHLKALARASRVFKDGDFRAKLMSVTNGDSRKKMWDLLVEEDRRISQGEL